MYGGRIRAEERTENPLVQRRNRYMNPGFPFTLRLEVVGIGAEYAVAPSAAQHQDGAQFAHCSQRPTDSGTAHSQQPTDPAYGWKGPNAVARLLEQAQTHAECSMPEIPVEDLTGNQSVVLHYRQQAGVGGSFISHAPDLLLVLVGVKL